MQGFVAVDTTHETTNRNSNKSAVKKLKKPLIAALQKWEEEQNEDIIWGKINYILDFHDIEPEELLKLNPDCNIEVFSQIFAILTRQNYGDFDRVKNRIKQCSKKYVNTILGLVKLSEDLRHADNSLSLILSNVFKTADYSLFTWDNISQLINRGAKYSTIGVIIDNRTQDMLSLAVRLGLKDIVKGLLKLPKIDEHIYFAVDEVAYNPSISPEMMVLICTNVHWHILLGKAIHAQNLNMLKEACKKPGIDVKIAFDLTFGIFAYNKGVFAPHIMQTIINELCRIPGANGDLALQSLKAMFKDSDDVIATIKQELYLALDIKAGGMQHTSTNLMPVMVHANLIRSQITQVPTARQGLDALLNEQPQTASQTSPKAASAPSNLPAQDANEPEYNNTSQSQLISASISNAGAQLVSAERNRSSSRHILAKKPFYSNKIYAGTVVGAAIGVVSLNVAAHCLVQQSAVNLTQRNALFASAAIISVIGVISVILAINESIRRKVTHNNLPVTECLVKS
jgi:hypothetical protein